MKAHSRRFSPSAIAAIAAIAACSSRGDHRAGEVESPTVAAEASKSLVASMEPLRARSTERRAWLDRQQIVVARTEHAADVVLPPTADRGFTLTDTSSGVAWTVSMAGASASAAEIVDGVVLYRKAYRGRADIAHVLAHGGTEDFVQLTAEDDEGALVYDVKLEGTLAGVRVAPNVVEALDATGTPRLRVSHPYLVDAVGQKRWATLEVEGCVVDDRPGMPWGRAPIAPQSGACRISVRWNRDGLRYPIVVDPAWTPTFGITTVPRPSHMAASLPDGRVLVAGGGGCGAELSTAEVYDPTSGTFAATNNAMSVVRAYAQARVTGSDVLIVDGGNYVPGGSGSCNWLAYSNAELYDPTSAKFVAAPKLSTTRYGATATTLADGRVLVVGGYSATNTALKSAEIYNPSTQSFSAAGTPLAARTNGAAILLASNKVLIAGGDNAVNPTTELYDPSTNAFATTGALLFSSFYTSGIFATLDSTRVLWVGDDETEIYTIATGTFAKGPTTSFFGSLTARLGSGVAFAENNQTALYLYSLSSNAFKTASSSPVSIGSLTSILSGTALLAVPSTTTDRQAYVYAPLATASKCTNPTDCASGVCVDGICCSGACTGTCMTCSAALKGSGADGVCGPVAVGKTHSTCASSSCTAGVKTNAQTCDATQHCASNGTVACSPFACGSGTCLSSCTADSQCSSGFFCSGGSCVSSLLNGSACTVGTQCGSGSCVEGVCCDTACNGTCVSCVAAKKGSGNDGTCGPIAAGVDPDAECAADVGYPKSCKADGACDGAGACRVFAASGTVCGNASCTSGVLVGQQCDGSGNCALATTSCAPGVCAASGDACTSLCAADTDCAPGAYCSPAGTCLTKGTSGATCTRAAECTTGYCADGACCNTPCTGACEACAEPGSVGVCAPVSGAPRGGHAACTGDPAVCGGSCNGVDPTNCTYAPASKVCASSCAAGTTSRSLCDGQGACKPASPQSCGAYVCDATECKTTCASDADCTADSRCDTASAHCAPQKGANCSADGSQSIPTNTSEPAVPCAPYVCSQPTGACATSCRSSDDCATNAACDNGICVLASGGTGSGGGCAIVENGMRGEGSAYAVIGLVACFGVLARRARVRRRGAR